MECAAIEAEALGWQPLGEGVYVHHVDPSQTVIEVVGIAQPSHAEVNTVLLT